jgi:hypothetical protein
VTNTPRLTTIGLVVARLGNAMLAVLTATYCLLTYSPFAYEQFIKPHLVNWLSSLPVWHHVAFWAAAGVTAVTMMRELPAVRARWVGWSYLAASTLAGIVLLVYPVLPSVENDGRGLVLAVAALVSPIWLAWYDHLATSGSTVPRATSDSRVLKAFLVAGAVVWIEQTLASPLRVHQTGEIALSAAATGFGIVTSLVGHLVVFAALPLALVGTMRVVRTIRAGGSAEYWLIVALAGASAMLVLSRLVFGAISFRGAAAWALSAVAGAAFALVWSSIARRLAPVRAEESALDVWLRPVPGWSRGAAAAGLIALGFAGYLLIAAVARFDWDFLVQRLVVIGIWFVAVAYGCRLVADGGRLSWPSLAAPACVALPLFGMASLVQPRLTHLFGDERFVAEFALEGYVAVDPSYGLIRYLLRVPSQADAQFFEELRQENSLPGVTLVPVDVDFVRPLTPASGERPHIILLLVDSLRRDYLSPYNPAVGFTPSIERFAADSIVFERTFARYGGTGLAMPALWTGGLVMPRQYVTPYSPMNALEKLLDVNGYRRVLSVDHITAQIVKAPAAAIELDRGRPEMRYDLCATLGEISTAVPRSAWAAGPLFVHTRSLNLHIAHVRKTPVPAGAAYPGFVAPVAASIERMDRCFGGFIQHLQEQGLYDDSIIVLTSDHGDSLGESLRWGHSYTMFPEVIRVPLIVRVPPRLRERLHADPASVSFSTDITPTLYALIGYEPANLGPLFGAPLVVPSSTAPSPRTQPFLLASSYGPVYGVLRDNGRYVYVADAVNNRDYAYRMGESSRERVGITPEDREANRMFIREQLRELARAYRFERP